jgi:osmotically-inducible protein OsmY
MKPKTSTIGAAIVAALFLSIAPPVDAATATVYDLTPQVQSAGLDIEGLRAQEVGGIVVLTGRTADRTAAERAGLILRDLGYARVANLIRITAEPDDAAIARTAERQLGRHRALDGCKFRIDSKKGVLRVEGRVRYEMQKDVAMDVLRNISGVRTVETDLQK